MIKYEYMHNPSSKFKFKVKVRIGNTDHIYTVDNITKLLSIEHNQTRKKAIAMDPGIVKISNGECDIFINNIQVNSNSIVYQLISQWFGSLIVDPITG